MTPRQRSRARAARLIAAALQPPDPDRTSSLTRRLDPATGRVLALLPVSGHPARPPRPRGRPRATPTPFW